MILGIEASWPCDLAVPKCTKQANEYLVATHAHMTMIMFMQVLMEE